MDSIERTDHAGLTESLKAQARAEGFDLVGVTTAQPSDSIERYRNWIERGWHGEMQYLADHALMKSDPGNLLPGATSILMVGLNYYQPAPSEVKIARYALGRDYHRVIRSKLKRVAASIPGETRICVDSAPLLEREYAHRAGLGWFGKNTMLINSQRGSWFLLGAILTMTELVPDAPAEGGCGTCRACIDACPTGAIQFAGDRWQVDARSCISYQTIERKGPEVAPTHGWTFGCDICQEVCPFNTIRESQPLRSAVTTEPDFDSRSWPSTEEILDLEPSEWDALTQGSAVRRAGFEGLKRNAKKALDSLD